MKRILLVERQKIISDMIIKHLEKEFTFDIMTDSDDAFEYVEKKYKDINLIIVDFNLKPIDGYQLIQKLKLNNEYRKIPIILLSSDFDSSNIVLGIHSGISSYLKKPFLLRELKEHIQNIFLS